MDNATLTSLTRAWQVGEVRRVKDRFLGVGDGCWQTSGRLRDVELLLTAARAVLNRGGDRSRLLLQRVHAEEAP